MTQRILHKRSNVVTDGSPKLPTADQLEYGELAINYAYGNETLSIKNKINDIVSFKSQEYIDRNDLLIRGNGNGSIKKKADISTATANGSYSVNLGYDSTVSNAYAYAEGYKNTASGHAAHAEGDQNQALAGCSHAEGHYTKAGWYGSHAEGGSTEASGLYSHAECEHTTASNTAAHAEQLKGQLPIPKVGEQKL